MKEFLQFVWSLFVLVVLVGSIYTKCNADRYPPPRTYNLPSDRNKPMQLPKLSTPTYGAFPTYPKLPAWESYSVSRPRPAVAPMPREKLEAAPAPRAKVAAAPMPHAAESPDAD